MWVVFKSFLIFSLLKIFFRHPFFVDASEEINYIGCFSPLILFSLISCLFSVLPLILKAFLECLVILVHCELNI